MSSSVTERQSLRSATSLLARWRSAVTQSQFWREVIANDLEWMIHDSLLRVRLFAWALITGEPMYYLFWLYVAPEPVESLFLRVTSALLPVPLMFRRVHEQVSPRWRNLYWGFLTCWTLPFSFFCLYRMNGFDDVWMASSVCAIFILYMLTDWRLATLEVIIGALAVSLIPQSLFSRAVPTSGIPLAHWGVLAFALFTSVWLSMSAANMRFVRSRAARATIGVLAHEFRTPLSSAALLVEALEDDLPTADARSRARITRLKSIFESLHSMIDYQISSTRMMDVPRERETVDLGKLVRSAIASFPWEGGARQQEVEYQEPDDQLYVSVHEQLMKQVVHNLLSNAIKAVHATGRPVRAGDLTVRVFRCEDSHAAVEIVDRGVGIASDKLDRIFDAFYSTAGMPAHGLGLTMCRNAVVAFGGEISARSEDGQGAVFLVRLPIVRL